MHHDTDRYLVRTMAARHSVSEPAVEAMIEALRRSGGSMAQFNHADLGGMGQWSSGMTMIGDMFNDALKGRVAALAQDLANHLRDESVSGKGGSELLSPRSTTMASQTWWPADLGHAASTGSQNGMRYAVFPAARRLAIENAGTVSIYDTGDHVISGAGQQQGSSSALTFTSQHGTVRVEDLKPISDR